MGEDCACGCKNENPDPKAPNKALKYLLTAFVLLSVGAAAYKILGAPCCPTAKVPASDAAAAIKPAGSPVKPKAEKVALVYYFYTDARCSSCKSIEAYTKEAVERNFAAGYKGWQVNFKGVNIDEKSNARFAGIYALNTKSVVVQKFSGDKTLEWSKLEEVWTLLGDKEAFVNYVTGETRKLLDAK